MPQTLFIKFPDQTLAQQAQLVSSLQDTIAGLKGISDVEVRRKRPESQDTGTVISLVLNAPALLLLVRSVCAWSVRNNQSTITFEDVDGRKFTATNLSSEDVPKTVDALTRDLLRGAE